MKRRSAQSTLVLSVVASMCVIVLTSVAAEAGERWKLGSRIDSLWSELGSHKRQKPGERGWHFRAYLDLGYVGDFNDPGNGLWRSKSTTSEVNNPRVNMAMANVRHDAVQQSPWGMEFGVQGGVDVDGLVPGAAPVSNAETYKYLYRANASYLFRAAKDIRVSAGLINSYIAYESYHAIENPNYTRGYIADNVPYFFVGLGAFSQLSDAVGLALFVVVGWNYLEESNDAPSFGGQMSWQASSTITITQNLYYGPEQQNTDLEFWRFFSDTIVEWKKTPFLVAASFDVGTEGNAEQSGNPRDYWMAGALWTGWRFTGPWIVAFRPEFYWDPQGVITGAEQLIQAYAVTLSFNPPDIASNAVRASLEYRFDRSTGSEGGFYKGPDNRLVPDQHLLIVSMMVRFDR